MKGAAKIYIEVLVNNDGDLVAEVGDKPASWERTIVRHKDEYKKIIGDGNARVSVTLSERIGAEHYSSCSVSATVTLTCNQDQETIQRAEKMALNEGLAFLDEHVPVAWELLTQHQLLLYRDH